jgi:hypothetical protein
MRLFHFVQPRGSPRPTWRCADQRSDSPCAAISRMSSGSSRNHDITIVFGGAEAVTDARSFGLNTLSHAPVCGSSRLGLRRLRFLDQTRNAADVLVGWGIQFREVFDELMPRSNAIVIDLATGVAFVRSLMQSAWHTLPALPARLGSELGPSASRSNSHLRTGSVAIGLCRDGPAIEPLSSFIFAMGGVAVSGLEIDAVVSPDIRDLSKIKRHTQEGGRLRSVRLLTKPVALSGAEADLWIYALTPKSGVATAADSTDWSSLLAADALAERGFNVVAALPQRNFIPPSIAPRTMFAQANALSDVAGAMRNWLIEGRMTTMAFDATDLPTTLLRIAHRISAKEPIIEPSAGI